MGSCGEAAGRGVFGPCSCSGSGVGDDVGSGKDWATARTTLVTRPRSSRSRACSRREGKSTCSVARMARSAAEQDLSGLLVVEALEVPGPHCSGKEEMRLVRSCRGEGRRRAIA